MTNIDRNAELKRREKSEEEGKHGRIVVRLDHKFVGWMKGVVLKYTTVNLALEFCPRILPTSKVCLLLSKSLFHRTRKRRVVFQLFVQTCLVNIFFVSVEQQIRYRCD